MEDEDRNKALKGITTDQMQEIADASNHYPCVNMSYNIEDEDIAVGDQVKVDIALERDGDEFYQYVYAPYYPK